MPPPPAKLKMAHVPTPIEHYPQLLPGLWVKRDDLTGSELSGNKVRKLDYLVAEALEQGADTLVTAGDVQSNHARATAVAAARYGLRCLLILEGPAEPGEWDRGNALVDRCVGAEIDWQSQEGELPQRLEACRQRLVGQGRRPYLIPVGGSCELGVWGYIEAAGEAKQQCQQMGLQPDRIVCVAGSCGTLVGLLLGVKLSQWPVRVTGIGISSTAEKKARWAWQLLQRTMARYELPVTIEQDEIEIHDYSGAGYARSQPQELACIADVARRTGLLLDPVYTGKAYYGLTDLVARGIVGQHEKLLFFHTGGLLGLTAKADSLPLAEPPG